jgi:hypothetical protein
VLQACGNPVHRVGVCGGCFGLRCERLFDAGCDGVGEPAFAVGAALQPVGEAIHAAGNIGRREQPNVVRDAQPAEAATGSTPNQRTPAASDAVVSPETVGVPGADAALEDDRLLAAAGTAERLSGSRG